jgi:hypothetical protein
MWVPELSPELIAVFRSCGWSENRQVDIEPIRELLMSRGIGMHSAAAAFLQQFHGLTIASPSNPQNPVLVDLLQLVNWMKPEEPSFWTGLLGVSLCPIGLSGWSYLLLSPSWQTVFLGDDWTYFTHFPDLNSAFEACLLQQTQDRSHQSIPEELRPPSFRSSNSDFGPKKS